MLHKTTSNVQSPIWPVEHCAQDFMTESALLFFASQTVFYKFPIQAKNPEQDKCLSIPPDITP